MSSEGSRLSRIEMKIVNFGCSVFRAFNVFDNHTDHGTASVGQHDSEHHAHLSTASPLSPCVVFLWVRGGVAAPGIKIISANGRTTQRPCVLFPFAGCSVVVIFPFQSRQNNPKPRQKWERSAPSGPVKQYPDQREWWHGWHRWVLTIGRSASSTSQSKDGRQSSAARGALRHQLLRAIRGHMFATTSFHRPRPIEGHSPMSAAVNMIFKKRLQMTSRMEQVGDHLQRHAGVIQVTHTSTHTHTHQHVTHSGKTSEHDERLQDLWWHWDPRDFFHVRCLFFCAKRTHRHKTHTTSRTHTTPPKYKTHMSVLVGRIWDRLLCQVRAVPLQPVIHSGTHQYTLHVVSKNMFEPNAKKRSRVAHIEPNTSPSLDRSWPWLCALVSERTSKPVATLLLANTDQCVNIPSERPRKPPDSFLGSLGPDNRLVCCDAGSATHFHHGLPSRCLQKDWWRPWMRSLTCLTCALWICNTHQHTYTTRVRCTTSHRTTPRRTAQLHLLQHTHQTSHTPTSTTQHALPFVAFEKHDLENVLTQCDFQPRALQTRACGENVSCCSNSVTQRSAAKARSWSKEALSPPTVAPMMPSPSTHQETGVRFQRRRVESLWDTCRANFEPLSGVARALFSSLATVASSHHTKDPPEPLRATLFAEALLAHRSSSRGCPCNSCNSNRQQEHYRHQQHQHSTTTLTTLTTHHLTTFFFFSTTHHLFFLHHSLFFLFEQLFFFFWTHFFTIFLNPFF